MEGGIPLPFFAGKTAASLCPMFPILEKGRCIALEEVRIWLRRQRKKESRCPGKPMKRGWMRENWVRELSV
jgi:hypothetical protein